LQLQISLAPEVAGLFGGFEMTNKIASARKSLLAEFGDATEVTENGIADFRGFAGKVRLVESALQKSSGWQDDTSRRSGALARGDN